LTFFRRFYMTVDPRSLAAGRIALALVLLLDLAKRWVDFSTWYTNDGLLPNHTLLWRPTYTWVFSFFNMASYEQGALLGFVICLVVYLALLFGYRTRLAQVLTVGCVLSLHGRVLFLQNGGDVVLGELALWTAFLPTGRRYSIDSLRARLRTDGAQSAVDLENRDAAPPDGRQVVSIAYLALLLQAVVIYAFNAIQKGGANWLDGSAVHFALHQDRMVTALGVWARENAPPAAIRAFTYAALGIEAAAPILLVLPVKSGSTRRLAAILLCSLHVGFALFLNLGVFVPSMIAYLPNFLSGRDFDAVEAWWRRRIGRRRTVIFDADCGFCFWIVRTLAHLDRAGRLTFVGNDETAKIPKDVPLDLLDKTILVIDESSGRRSTRAAAIAQALSCLPAGFLLAGLMSLPLVRQLANVVYDAIANRRTRISTLLGMAACGVPSVARKGSEPEEKKPAAPFRRWVRARVAPLRELTVVILLILSGSQLLTENYVFAAIRPSTRRDFIVAAVEYLQLFQGWFMFAPTAPTSDEAIFVDAVTRDGRHVDPFNEVASSTAALSIPWTRVPTRLGQDSYFCDYAQRIAGNRNYHQAFLEWIIAYPSRTGRAGDAIVSFEAFHVVDESPPLGEREPRNARVEKFLSYRAP
jgi:predicted DCC family thiol-disulfide oxidoreductase YuxK